MDTLKCFLETYQYVSITVCACAFTRSEDVQSCHADILLRPWAISHLWFVLEKIQALVGDELYVKLCSFAHAFFVGLVCSWLMCWCVRRFLRTYCQAILHSSCSFQELFCFFAVEKLFLSCSQRHVWVNTTLFYCHTVATPSRAMLDTQSWMKHGYYIIWRHIIRPQPYKHSLVFALITFVCFCCRKFVSPRVFLAPTLQEWSHIVTLPWKLQRI